MTRAAQKAEEKHYVRAFLEGLTDYTSVEAGERPDFMVRRTAGPDIALEVTEYHQDAEGLVGIPRSAVEARWWKELEPLLEVERRTRPALKDVIVHLQFNGPELPKKGLHRELARELARLVESVALHAGAHDIEVVFAPRATIAVVGSWMGGCLFLAEEDWAEASKCLSMLRVSRRPGLTGLPWTCLNVAAAWVGASENEFRRILDGKAAKAQTYTLGGAPLWLLIVCEVHGDVQSHIFPRTDFDLAQLAVSIQATRFDFQHGPFSQVWLFSAFGGGRLRLHPPQEPEPPHWDVAVAAYYIWEQEGRPHGRDKEHWYKALAQLESRTAHGSGTAEARP
jgi:hypothetical protein